MLCISFWVYIELFGWIKTAEQTYNLKGYLHVYVCVQNKARLKQSQMIRNSRQGYLTKNTGATKYPVVMFRTIIQHFHSLDLSCTVVSSTVLSSILHCVLNHGCVIRSHDQSYCTGRSPQRVAQWNSSIRTPPEIRMPL